MPDIAMCHRDDCKRAKECYRFMAEPNQYLQSYILIEDPETCGHFWPIDGRRIDSALQESSDGDS